MAVEGGHEARHTSGPAPCPHQGDHVRQGVGMNGACGDGGRRSGYDVLGSCGCSLPPWEGAGYDGDDVSVVMKKIT